MKTIIQAFTGGFHSSLGYSEIAKRLVAYAEKSGAETVLVGWDLQSPYKEIVSRLHEKAIEVYLWLPVFSEYGSEAVRAVDYLGRQHQNAVSAAADDFTFSCPSDKSNIALVLDYYDNYFSAMGFDGVFLDKIRFSSFANGFSSAIGCFCDDCRDRYRRENIAIDEIKKLLSNANKDFLIPSGLREMRYCFTDEKIEAFFVARAGLITASVNKLIQSFKSRGLKVGLDVFAPVFAYLVGQDIAELAKTADFIKPMMYNVTDAPAGIPYEAKHLKLQLKENGCDIEDSLEKLWESKALDDVTIFNKQLRLLKKLPCAIYPGIEVNKVAICATSKTYVETMKETLQEVGLPGWVLSWSVLEETVYPG